MSTVFNGSRLQNKVVLITGASGGIGAVGDTASFTLEIALNYPGLIELQAAAILFARVS
jgi:hypothetical protein